MVQTHKTRRTWLHQKANTKALASSMPVHHWCNQTQTHVANSQNTTHTVSPQGKYQGACLVLACPTPAKSTTTTTTHDDPSCRYCEALIEDREHILTHCPRYMTIRSRWLQIGQHRHGDDLRWDLQTLARIGLPFLAGFLQDVQILWDKQQQGTSWGPR